MFNLRYTKVCRLHYNTRMQHVESIHSKKTLYILQTFALNIYSQNTDFFINKSVKHLRSGLIPQNLTKQLISAGDPRIFTA